MPYCAYQGVATSSPPPPSVSLSNGGSITLSGTLYFWLQTRNRAGYSLVSAVRTISYTPGKIIEIVIPSAARPSPDNGTYLYEFVILANTTNDPATARIIATYPGYENDDVTPRTLPGLINLSRDSHLRLGATVPLLSDLSSIVGPIHGMRRLVEEDDTILPATTFNKIVYYSETGTPGWYLAQDQIFSTYVSSLTGTLGALTDIYTVRDQDVITPTYALSPDPNIRSPSVPVGYWLINDTSSPIKSGTRVAMTAAIGEDDLSRELTGRLLVIFRGYVNTSNGILDRGNGSGGTMAAVGEPLEYGGDTIHIFALPKDLPAGSACWFDVRAIMTLAELNNRAPIGSRLRFAFAFFAYKSILASPVSLLGSFIAAQYDRRYLVPTLGLGLKALNGSGKLLFETIGTSFDFWNVGEQDIPGLEANTPDQNIYITKEGSCFVMDVPTATVVLRGQVGTVDGIGTATSWATPVALNGSQVLRITVTYPTQIRSNYPDPAISGNAKGRFNAYGLRFWVRKVGQAAVYYDMVITPSLTSEVFTIGGTTGTPGEPSTPADPYFGLFQVANNGFAVATTTQYSVLTAGNYEVAVSLRYFGNVTKIRHNLPGVIHTFDSSIQDVWERSEYWRSATASAIALRNWTDEVTAGMRVGLLESPDIYYWDQDSVAADDGSEVIKVSTIATGRFVRLRPTPNFVAGDGIEIEDTGTEITIRSIPPSNEGILMGFGVFTYSE